MSHYRVHLYNVPDKHLYDPFPLRIWRRFWAASWQIRAAVGIYVLGFWILLDHFVF